MKTLITFLLLTCCTMGYAETLVWTGNVDSNGNPTPSIKLILGEKYKIKVSGLMTLGHWWQDGEILETDACYEFNTKLTPASKAKAFQNSLNVSVCDGNYHPDHVYESNAFVAAQNGIHFWIFDQDYSDNKGSLKVEIYKL